MFMYLQLKTESISKPFWSTRLQISSLNPLPSYRFMTSLQSVAVIIVKVVTLIILKLSKYMKNKKDTLPESKKISSGLDLISTIFKLHYEQEFGSISFRSQIFRTWKRWKAETTVIALQ